MKHLYPLLLIPLLCLACARTPPPGSVRLNTLITPDGLKLFELALPPMGPPVVDARGTGKRPSPPPNEARMLSLLNTAMEETGYCREGFIILGRYAGETTSRVRGECRDRATEEDRQRYPDSVARW
jgi:hypothetical protein